MDRSFMKKFYKRYYDSPQSEAVKESKEYMVRRNQRQEIEEKIDTEVQKLGEGFNQLLNDYVDAIFEEQEILMEELYLMGAADRERMLRGGI